MSYSIGLFIDTGGEEEAEVANLGSLTWNLSPLAVQLGIHARDDLHGRQAGELIPLLESALVKLDEHPYKHWDPYIRGPWGGGVGGLKDWINNTIHECKRHPKTTFRAR